jgi:sugar phosphate isomerase/epimerase
MNNIGLQLHTVRTELQKDFEKTIARVAEIGYAEVELAGLFGRPAKEVRSILDRHGLPAPAGHVGIENLGPNWQRSLDDALMLGHRFVVIPGFGGAAQSDQDGWKRAAQLFNEAGMISKDCGILLAFHNHASEFVPIGGRLPYDILLEECDPTLVDMELDICWIIAGGQDPLEYFKNHPGRFPLLHMKDVVEVAPAPDSPPGSVQDRFIMTEVGSGIVDWNSIVTHAAAQGTVHYFVEHDHPDRPLESIKQSFIFLDTLKAG